MNADEFARRRAGAGATNGSRSASHPASINPSAADWFLRRLISCLILLFTLCFCSRLTQVSLSLFCKLPNLYFWCKTRHLFVFDLRTSASIKHTMSTVHLREATVPQLPQSRRISVQSVHEHKNTSLLKLKESKDERETNCFLNWSQCVCDYIPVRVDVCRFVDVRLRSICT